MSAELLQACRGSVKADLMRYEQLLLSGEKQGLELTLIDAEANRLRALLDAIDALSSDAPTSQINPGSATREDGHG